MIHDEMTEPDWSDQAQVRAQVAAQYAEVAALAQTLADLHREVGEMIERYPDDSNGVLYIQGVQSYSLMNRLGDWLNGSDAVTPEDEERGALVFKRAHSLKAHFDAKRSGRYPREDTP